MARAEIRAAAAELRRIEIFGSVERAGGMATSVRRRHMVKPMPPSMPTIPRWRKSMPCGSLAMPRRSASQVNKKIPRGLPMSSPAAMPRAGAIEVAAAAAEAAEVAPADPRRTAVFASAKRGITIKEVKGASRRIARSVRGSASFAPSGATIVRVEMHSAASTPATSELTPARSKQYHKPTAPAPKTLRLARPRRPSTPSAAQRAPAAPRNQKETL
mmetsp:Transcript_4844/g.10272  ORF Transcript_4844/g.10272 Transcript_4844/m.10272 type:complete len:216 (+) Transcript_4844:831-1478(+)